jgi:DNA-directed RNA polymerase subunit M/transcription elongation factor TFIIS
MTSDAGDPESIAGTVRCACGTAVPVRLDGVGREQSCPSCSASFKAVWAVDPRSREKVLSRIASTGKDFRIPVGSLELVCSCGQVLVARKDQAGKKVKCPVCGKSMVIERYKDPQTMETRVRRAGEGGSAATPTAAGETAVFTAKPLGRTTRRRRAPSGAQDILCGCGEYLRVFVEHLEKKVMCPECGTLMKMEKAKDPQTSITQVRPRIVGKGEPPPRTDPDQWSLDDFA